MLTEHCRDCKNVIWMVGLGLGVRCSHPDNKEYSKTNLPPLISSVFDCKIYRKKE